MDSRREFVKFAVDTGVLRFGSFTTKAGRESPYFFNAGLLAAGTAMQIAQRGRDLPFAFNRKEAKDHGEGGMLIGAPLKGRVLIIDDVISAGTSVRESVELIRAAGAEPAGVAIALDRMERGTGQLSAVQEVERSYGMPVVACATLDDLVGYLQESPGMQGNLDAVRAYRAKYGVNG